MNKVEKMYKLANVKAKEYCDRDSDACMNCCPEWKNRQNCWKYKSAMPPFTAEKQLELIKWLAKYDISIWHTKVWDIEADELSGCISGEVFENVLAQYINYIWQDLTEEERKQIKEILK